MKILQNESLTKHSTMRIGGLAAFFVEISSPNDIQELIDFLKRPEIKELPQKPLVIGEGSNTIFLDDYKGAIICNKVKGTRIVEDKKDFVTVEVEGGTNWHEFVEYCVNKDLTGNENLAYIPGTVGAAPVQNIAAYGQVQEDTFVSLTAVDLKTGEKRIFDETECEFEYRSSIFKKKYKNKYIITSVSYKLKRVEDYKPETSYYSRYESLSDELKLIAQEPYSLKDVFNAVISIRKKKLPDPKDIGTVGSFFQNPFVTRDHLNKLLEKFPGLQYYPIDKMQYPGLDDELLQSAEIVKIAIAWVLEELGWRGKRIGNVGCSEKHALCIVAYPNATAKDLSHFMSEVKKDVLKKTGIQLESEVNIIE